MSLNYCHGICVCVLQAQRQECQHGGYTNRLTYASSSRLVLAVYTLDSYKSQSNNIRVALHISKGVHEGQQYSNSTSSSSSSSVARRVVAHTKQ
jgi:hypothetical protein